MQIVFLFLAIAGIAATTYYGIKAIRAAASRKQVEGLKQDIKDLKEAFNGWAVPSDERLRRLLAEQGRRENLAKAAELAKANKQREAIEHLEACLAPQTGPADRAAIYLLMGNAYIAISELVQAEAAFKNSLAAAKGIAETREKKDAEAGAMNNLGSVYFHKGEMDKALEHLQKALEIHREIGHRLGEAAAVGNLGSVFRIRGELDKALEHHQKALEIYRQIKDRQEEAGTLINLGNVYFQRGEMEKALEHHQKALEINRGIGNRLGEAGALGNLGIVFRLKGELNKALQHHQKALQIYRDIDNRLEEAVELDNLGNIYLQNDDLEGAREHHQKALEIHREIGYRLGEAEALNNLGVVFGQKGELEKALEHYQGALALFRAIGTQPEIASTERNIAKAEQAKKQAAPPGKD